MADPTALQIKRRADTLKRDRAQLESQWDEIAQYCNPRNQQFLARRTVGEPLPIDVYDSTARYSLEVLAAGLMGRLTPPSGKWFELVMNDPALMEIDGVRDWLADARDRVFQVFRLSNFYPELHEFYLDTVGFGTGCFYSEEDPIDKLRYYARNVREVVFAEDAKGRPNLVYRLYTLTAEQAFGQFGEGSGKAISAAMEQKDFDKPLPFIHAIGARDAFDSSKLDKLNKPWYSLIVNHTDEQIVQQGGYDDLPYHIVRFLKVTHEPYGYSPAMHVMPEIRMVNKMKKTILRAASKVTDPPFAVADQAFILPLNMNPSGANVFNPALLQQGRDGITFLNPGGNVNLGLEILQAEQQTIRRAFFVDLFISLTEQTQNMTAREVVERVAEKMLLLGPALGRLMGELLNPIVIRTFKVLRRTGVIPDPPQELAGQDYSVNYISSLAKSQQISDVQGMMQFAQIVGFLAQFAPNVTDKLDADRIVDQAADRLGVDARLIRDQGVVEEIRAQKAQMQQMATQLEALKSGSESVKNLAQADQAARPAQTNGNRPTGL